MTTRENSRNILNNRKIQLIIAIALFFVMMAVSKPDIFLTMTSMQSMLVQISDIGIFALAMAITRIAGGIDLSLINLANLITIINALIIKAVITETSSAAEIYVVILVCLIIGLIIGIIAGAINSFFIANLKIPEILATLATMNLYLGISLIITKGTGIIGFPQQLLDLGEKNFFGIPIPFVIFLGMAAILFIIVHKTPYGTQLKLYGMNEKASFFSGINNLKVIYTTHIIACMFASVAGLMIMARTNSATVNYGALITLTTLLVAALSGISPTGGTGDILNIFLALFLMQLIKSGLNLLRVSSFIRELVPAALLIGIISLEYNLNILNERRLNRRVLQKNIATASTNLKKEK